MAQVVERFVRDEEAASSSLVTPTGALLWCAGIQAEFHSHPVAIGLTGVHIFGSPCARMRYWDGFVHSVRTGRESGVDICGYPLFYVLFHLMEGKAISELFINEQIRDREVRLIGENGQQLGIMPARDALRLAEEAGLDLVKIAPTAKPPVCKIVDYGKYRYELARKEKDARRKQKTIEIKEIRMSPNIDTNDLNTKANAARKFLEKGNRVKVTLRFRGREMAHMSTSKHILDDFARMLSDISVMEKPPKVEGRSMIMFLTEKR